MKTKLEICLIFTALALLIIVGCNKAAEKAQEATPNTITETASPAATAVDVRQEKTQIETLSESEVDEAEDEGEATTKSETVTAVPKPKPLSMPDSWPTAFPQYPGSTITASQGNIKKGLAKMKVTLSTEDPIGDVVSFYADKAKAGGYKTNISQDMGAIRIRHYVSSENIVDLNIIQKRRTVEIKMSVRPNKGG